MINSYLLSIIALLLSNERIGYVQMLDIATSLLAKLKLEPESALMTLLIDRLQAILDIYEVDIDKWINDKSYKKGKVDEFSKLILTVPHTLDIWRTAVKTEMPGNSNVLLVLFGKDISVFYSGKQSEIVREFKNLRTRMHSYPEIAAIEAKVVDFNIHLNSAYNSKTDIKDNVVIDSSSIVEDHRILGGVLLGTYGRLLDEFQLTPYQVERFFDRTIMKRNEKDPEKLRVNQSRYEIPVGVTVNAIKVVLHPKGYLVLESELDAPVIVYTAATINAPVPPEALVIPAFGKIKIKVSELGSILNLYLLLKVASGVNPGQLKISSLKFN